MIQTNDFLLLAVGASGFVICIVSDFVGLRKKKLATAMFVVGMIVTITATACVLIFNIDLVEAYRSAPVLRKLATFGAAIFLFLKIYALASIPNENYTDATEGNLVDTGLYALCRHPGTLFLAGIYISLALMTDSYLMWVMSAVNITMEMVYIIIQDIYIFPRTIAGYREYKKQTPFLIPSKKSIKRALKRGN